jgi:hypothetical protein
MSDHQELIEWGAESAATALKTSASTIRRRMKKAGIDPAKGFSTQQLLKAFSDAEDDRVREALARIEHWQLKARKLRLKFKPTRFMRVGLAALIKASLNVIEDSELSKRDKQDISEAINSLAGVVDVSLESQSELMKALRRHRAEGEGDE